MTDQTGTELVLSGTVELTSFYAAAGKPSQIDSVLERIEKEVRSTHIEVRNKTTAAEARSLAAKVSKAKVALDEAGKSLTEGWRAQTDAVNAERKRITTRLDALRDEAKKPAVEWEEREAAREKAIQDKIASMTVAPEMAHLSSEALTELVERIEAVTVDSSFEEFEEIAVEMKASNLALAREFLAGAEKREADARELEELRQMKAKVEQERVDREAKEANEARLRARLEKIAVPDEISAESNATDIRVMMARFQGMDMDGWGDFLDQAESKRKAAIETLAGMARTADAREEAEREARAQERIKQAEQEAAAKAKADAENAAAAVEAKRQADETAKLIAEDRAAAERADADGRRKANAAHRAKILKAIDAALGSIAKKDIAQALIDGKVPYVEIKW